MKTNKFIAIFNKTLRQQQQAQEDDDYYNADSYQISQVDDELQFHGGSHEHEGICDGHGDETAESKLQKSYDGAMKKLCLVSFVSIFFIAAQLTGGIIAGSIAIMCDTAHLATDMIGFVIAIIALRLSLRKASGDYTYGWQRSEIIGTIISMVFLITITIWLVKEAVDRVINPTKIDADVMLFTAAAGLFFNLVQMAILHSGDDHFHPGGGHDHDHGHGHSHSHGEDGNINVDAAYLHALSDMINSIGVCIAATIIYFFPKAVIADPICAFVFAILVVVQVCPILRMSIHVLMEGAPDSIDQQKLIGRMKAVEGVTAVHDFHLWSLSVGKHALSCHVSCEGDSMRVLGDVTKICKTEFGIDHITIQIEDESAEGYENCKQTTHIEYPISEIEAQEKAADHHDH